MTYRMRLLVFFFESPPRIAGMVSGFAGGPVGSFVLLCGGFYGACARGGSSSFGPNFFVAALSVSLSLSHARSHTRTLAAHPPTSHPTHLPPSQTSRVGLCGGACNASAG